MDEIKFSVTMKVKTMYRFLMRHAYSGASGIINLVISGGALVLLLAGFADSTAGKVMLGIIAALFTIINPLYLYYKAAAQVRLTKMFSKPLEYVVNAEGITVSQGEESLQIAWTDLRKIIETKTDFYLYLSLTRAYIFPKEELDGKEKDFRKIVTEHINPAICKCRWKKGEI